MHIILNNIYRQIIYILYKGLHIHTVKDICRLNSKIFRHAEIYEYILNISVYINIIMFKGGYMQIK